MNVSIAMATYNGAKYLPEQLQSILDQTRKPNELIVTDDCSSDNTLEIIKEFSLNAPFDVFYSRNEKNLGYAGNFNAALMKTSGDLVFMSDQDDVWLPEKIDYITGLAGANPNKLLIMNDTALTDSDLNETGLTKLGQLKSSGLGDRRFVMGSCCAIRRELLDLCLPVPKAYKAHDNWLVDIADHISAKLISNKVLQYYRLHDANESIFITNRLNKLNRWHEFIHPMRNGLKNAVNPEPLEELLQQKIICTRGVERILNIENEGIYQNSLRVYLRQLQKEIDFIEFRKKTRSKPFLTRTFAVIRQLGRGDYHKFSCIRSAVRDMMG